VQLGADTDEIARRIDERDSRIPHGIELVVGLQMHHEHISPQNPMVTVCVPWREAE